MVTDVNCVNIYLTKKKIFPTSNVSRNCIVSCVDFEAILTPFGEVIRNRCLYYVEDNSWASVDVEYLVNCHLRLLHF